MHPTIRPNAIRSCLRPDLPVGGRLPHFLDKWREVTSDRWVLDVVEQGLVIDFVGVPPKFNGIRETSMPSSPSMHTILMQEVESLLQKGAIQEVPEGNREEGYYSTYFLVQKKSGDFRPILNLKILNRSVKKQKFKMETLARVLKGLRQGMWLTSMDLKDAYMHVPIRPSHQKFLRFSYAGKTYQYVVMPFGLTTAPRVFTKMIAPIAGYLHVRELLFFPYIDDLLQATMSQQTAKEHVISSVDLLTRMGWILNLEKSSLEPTQCLDFIGATINTKVGKAFLPEKRLNTIVALCTKVRKQISITARRFLELLGFMASTTFVVPFALLHMRPLQLYLLAHWRPNVDNIENAIPIKNAFRTHIVWWAEATNLSVGVPLQRDPPKVTITTDASLIGWGATMGDDAISGIWSENQSSLHINVLELTAVHNAVQHWKDKLSNKNVLIETDSTTVVSYIRRQGGTKSPTLCYRVWDLWKLCIDHDIFLTPVHIPGVQNMEADSLSRAQISPAEWEIVPSCINKVFLHWGKPHIDLFATDKNRKLDLFCSRVYLPGTYHVNGLTLNWDSLMAYAFPPLSLVPLVLQKAQQDKIPQLILIAPLWRRRSWYPLLLNLLIDLPVLLPEPREVLRMRGKKFPLSNLTLVAWKLSGRDSEISAFRGMLLKQSSSLEEYPPESHTIDTGRNSVAGVLDGVSVPFQHLWQRS